MLYFTADTHFNHAGIIKSCKRPFYSVEYMDRFLVTSWNHTVSPQDTVWFLGDFSFYLDEDEIDKLVNKLNGNISFILGNHDKKPLIRWHEKKYGFKPPVGKMVKDKKSGAKIWVSHYAHRVWPQSHYGSWHLYAHSHGNLEDDPYSLSMDVGVDPNNFRPVSLIEVAKKMSKKLWVPKHEININMEVLNDY